MEAIIRSVLNQINNENERSKTKNISLFNGLSGLALANFFTAKAIRDDSYLDKAEYFSDECVDLINFQKFEISNFFSLCSGFAGINFCLEMLAQGGVLNFDTDNEVEAIDSFIFDHGLKSLQYQKSDFLHGGIGILKYFSQKKDNQLNRRRVSDLLEAYYKSLKKDNLGYRVRNSVLIGRKIEEYDLGLAHGLCGNIIVLCEMADHFKNDLLYDIVNGHLSYIDTLARQPTSALNSYQSYYPTSNIELEDCFEENLEFYNSRLAWCYGELNYALMFLKVSKEFNSNLYHEQAMRIAKGTLNRKTEDTTQVKSPTFCHGVGGLVAIYQSLFKITNDYNFELQSNYWLKYMLDKYQNKFSHIIKSNPNCYLEGGISILFSLLSKVSSEEDDWRKIYLID